MGVLFDIMIDMRITLKEFRKRLNNQEWYVVLAERHQSKFLFIPKSVSPKTKLVKALLCNGVKASIIHKEHAVSYSYIRKLKLNKFLRAEKVFNKLVVLNRNEKQGDEIVNHLMKTCGGCSVYFKHTRSDLFHQLILKHYVEDRWSVDEIKVEFDSTILMQRPDDMGYNGLRSKTTCTRKYIQHIIRVYERATDPLYLPKKYKTTNMYV